MLDLLNSIQPKKKKQNVLNRHIHSSQRRRVLSGLVAKNKRYIVRLVIFYLYTIDGKMKRAENIDTQLRFNKVHAFLTKE